MESATAPAQTQLPRAALTARPALPIAALAILLIAVVGAIYGLRTLPRAAHSGVRAARTSSAPATSALRSAVADAVASWVAEALPRSARIAAPADLARLLRAHGFSAVTDLPAVGAVPASVQWIVAPPAKRSHALPVAQVGSGDGALEVWQSAPRSSPAALQAVLKQDAAARVTAGAALADNPRLRTDPAVKGTVRTGRLDLRATTLLALLADATPVRLSQIVAVPAETALGRPARTIRIAVSDPAALRRTLAALPTSYRPAAVTSGGGLTTLRWNVAVDPAPPVS